MNGIFVSPEPLCPRNLKLVGPAGAPEMVGIIPLAVVTAPIVKGINVTVVSGITTTWGIGMSTVFM